MDVTNIQSMYDNANEDSKMNIVLALAKTLNQTVESDNIETVEDLNNIFKNLITVAQNETNKSIDQITKECGF